MRGSYNKTGKGIQNPKNSKSGRAKAAPEHSMATAKTSKGKKRRGSQ